MISELLKSNNKVVVSKNKGIITYNNGISIIKFCDGSKLTAFINTGKQYGYERLSIEESYNKEDISKFNKIVRYEGSKIKKLVDFIGKIKAKVY